MPVSVYLILPVLGIFLGIDLVNTQCRVPECGMHECIKGIGLKFCQNYISFCNRIINKAIVKMAKELSKIYLIRAVGGSTQGQS